MAAEKSILAGLLGILLAFAIVVLILSNLFWWLHSFDVSDKYQSLRSGQATECKALDAAVNLLGTTTRGSHREQILSQMKNTDGALIFQHSDGNIEWGGIYFTFDANGSLSSIKRMTPRTCNP